MQQQGVNQRLRIVYSDRYSDDDYEYRHVILPSDLAKLIPKAHLLTETEWRNLGIQQSPGWIHYMHHQPEPHILLFRRAKNHPVESDYGRHPQNEPDHQMIQG
ncbi:cyclin-dependent kinases regulatory subunit [Brachionus plicatilis]|uniref:Cyclin-dependent kinases regulatory subunit n=1 Tax=Brachionus plicatilis TaxID=10195 RepID=A0A3M7SM39_BRAPC|nr:cyclin-dependent kinases regulatory subunit [Brachionus plicatilis]